jgi:alpha-1,2-mannosyltransferase
MNQEAERRIAMLADSTAIPTRFANGSLATRFAALFTAAATAIFTFAALAGVTDSQIIALTSSGVIGTIVGFRLWSRPIVPIDLSGWPRGFLAVSLVGAVVALVLLSRLTVFMTDPARTAYSTLPSSDWEVRHSCVTAYFVAGNVVRRTPNVYDSALYAAPDDDPTKPRKPQAIGIFRVDQYEYPPTFLLAPRAVSLVAPGFVRLRASWFGLSGLVLLVGLLLAARAMDPAAGSRALLLAPIVLASLGTLNTLQKGNVQVVVIATAVLAMAALERERRVLGGALLAFVTVAKLYPGLLVVYLLARRDWRGVMWTGAFAVVFVALTVADVGWQPFAFFREHFSALLSGEAFPAFRNPAAVAINLSIPGIVFKLKLFGLGDMGFGAARVVGTLYMLLAILATVVLARRPHRSGAGPLIWLTVLLLATLRSPFLPWSYATFPALWLLTLLAAADEPRRWTLLPFLATALLLAVILPVDFPLDPQVKALVATVPQLLMIALAVVGAQLHSETPTGLRANSRSGSAA